MKATSFHSHSRLAFRVERLWLLYLALAVGVAALYVFLDSLLARTFVSVGLLASGAVAAWIGIRLHRPKGVGYWAVAAAAISLWWLAWALWQSSIALHHGAQPALSSWRNFQFLGIYPLLAAVLLGLLQRREGRRASALDAAIIATSGLAIGWVVLGRLYADDSRLTVGVRVVQILFLAGDIVVAAAAARLLVSPGRRSPSLLLLVAGALSVVYSDFIWNWTTRLGHYLPGTWADLGWVSVGALVGAAALHPSMAVLYAEPRESSGRLGRGGLALLVAASLIVPATVVVTAAGGYNRHDVVVVALLGGVLTLLILFRLALVVGDEGKLVRALGAQNERLLELDRMKEDFVASVSHELRTPLTSIRGYLEIVQTGQAGELNEEQARFLGIVERNADRLLRVVGDLLLAAQVGAGKIDLVLEDVDFAAICRHAVLAARPHVESKGVELEEAIEPLSPMHADPARLGQVVDNLLSNAIKFTEPGGRIVLSTFLENGSTVLEVQDSGHGMTPAEQSQLFQRFYRTETAVDQAIQGTGLGLTIVKAIVEAHGGTIGLTSAKGIGTTFRVEFPARSAR